MEKLRATYKELLNHQLPEKYTYPVRYNHCFNRIVLDWLFSDCWYHHLDKKKTAISQLNAHQLQSAINRMNQWLSNQQILIEDNQRSLRYRGYLTMNDEL